jgi:hypothetical protein
MRFAPKGERAALDIFWYDGGIKPPVPEELMAENKELAEEGMLFVGDKGKVLGGFRGESPQLIPESKMRAYRAANNLPEPESGQAGAGGRRAGAEAARRRGSQHLREARQATAISCWRAQFAMR